VCVRPRRVYFRHAKPRDLREHEEFFAIEVRFDVEYDGFEFDRDTLAIPLPSADAELSQFLIEHLRSTAGDPASAATLEERVRQAICRRLGNEPLAMNALAEELGMCSRTLRRRLSERRTSYHDILDRVRRELADDC